MLLGDLSPEEEAAVRAQAAATFASTPGAGTSALPILSQLLANPFSPYADVGGVLEPPPATPWAIYAAMAAAVGVGAWFMFRRPPRR